MSALDELEEMMQRAASAQHILDSLPRNDLYRQIEQNERIRRDLDWAFTAERLASATLRSQVETVIRSVNQASKFIHSQDAIRCFERSLLAAALPAPMSVIAASSRTAERILGKPTFLATTLEYLQSRDFFGPHDFSTFLDDLDREFSEAIAKPQPSRAQTLGWLVNILAVLFALLSIAQNQWLYKLNAEQLKEIELRIADKCSSIQSQLDELSEMIEPTEEEPYDFYRVARRAPLKQKPKPKSIVLVWLSPGEFAWVRERAGRWVAIQVTDSLTGKSWEGWIRKKYLER
jgi:hypothetical protein